MSGTKPVTQPPELPQPGVATPEENAGTQAAIIYTSLLRQRAEAEDRYEKAKKAAEMPPEEADPDDRPRRRGLLSHGLGLGMGFVPWLARKLNLR